METVYFTVEKNTRHITISRTMDISHLIDVNSIQFPAKEILAKVSEYVDFNQIAEEMENKCLPDAINVCGFLPEKVTYEIKLTIPAKTCNHSYHLNGYEGDSEEEDEDFFTVSDDEESEEEDNSDDEENLNDEELDAEELHAEELDDEELDNEDWDDEGSDEDEDSEEWEEDWDSGDTGVFSSLEESEEDDE